jgi:prevent-host-death family protein
MQVNILEAKNRLSQLVKAAQAGDDVIIANRGVPVARLVPAENQNAPAIGSGRARDILDWLDRNPLPAHARRSREEIEAGIRDERNAWD